MDDKAGRRVGEVEGMEIDQASGRITRSSSVADVIFHKETAIPASLIASVGETGSRSASAPTR